MELLYAQCAGVGRARQYRGRVCRDRERRHGPVSPSHGRDDHTGAVRARRRLAARGAHVAMESTGVYWKPVWQMTPFHEHQPFTRADPPG